jgi:hypothetical protein
MDLFARIMRRLGLERQLEILRQHLGIVVSGLVVAFALGVWVVHILRSVLIWSSFGSMAHLAFTDPQVVLRFGNTYVQSVAGSFPAIEIACFCATVAAILLLVRLTVNDVDVYQSVKEKINEQRYEHDPNH